MDREFFIFAGCESVEKSLAKEFEIPDYLAVAVSGILPDIKTDRSKSKLENAERVIRSELGLDDKAGVIVYSLELLVTEKNTNNPTGDLYSWTPSEIAADRLYKTIVGRTDKYHATFHESMIHRYGTLSGRVEKKHKDDSFVLRDLCRVSFQDFSSDKYAQLLYGIMTNNVPQPNRATFGVKL